MKLPIAITLLLATPVLADPPGRFASRIVEFLPGEGAGYGQDQLPDVVLGPPRGAGKLMASTHVLSLGRGGRITLEFDGEIVDADGPDVLVFENAFLEAPGNNPDLGSFDLAKVEFSADGETWHEVPYDTATRQGCAGHDPVFANSEENDIDPGDPEKAGGDPFDLKDAGLKTARFLRITDLGGSRGENGTAGFDLDAVAAVGEENACQK